MEADCNLFSWPKLLVLKYSQTPARRRPVFMSLSFWICYLRQMRITYFVLYFIAVENVGRVDIQKRFQPSQGLIFFKEKNAKFLHLQISYRYENSKFLFLSNSFFPNISLKTKSTFGPLLFGALILFGYFLLFHFHSFTFIVTIPD